MISSACVLPINLRLGVEALTEGVQYNSSWAQKELLTSGILSTSKSARWWMTLIIFHAVHTWMR